MNAPLGSAMILAGGESRRMGRSKPDLPWHGRPLLEHLILHLKERFDPVIVVCGKTPRYLPEAICVLDNVPGEGPLGGLLSGFAHVLGDQVLVTACDMPFLHLPLLEFLWHTSIGSDAAVPITGQGPHPLCAVYAKSSEPLLQEAWREGERKMQRALARLHVRWVHEEELRQWDSGLSTFVNINSPEEWLDSLGKRSY